jgi:hypothetical protein
MTCCSCCCQGLASCCWKTIKAACSLIYSCMSCICIRARLQYRILRLREETVIEETPPRYDISAPPEGETIYVAPTHNVTTPMLQQKKYNQGDVELQSVTSTTQSDLDRATLRDAYKIHEQV